MRLSDGRKGFRIGLAVLIQYRSVTDTQPPSHVVVAITLYAVAPSAKSLSFHQRQHNETVIRLPGMIRIHDPDSDSDNFQNSIPFFHRLIKSRLDLHHADNASKAVFGSTPVSVHQNIRIWANTHACSGEARLWQLYHTNSSHWQHL